MNLNHLAIFDAVAREGNVTRAGERLRISQPAVSKQLQLLERAVGAPLVDRLPKGVRLTAAGELLAGYARRLFALADQADRAVAELQGLKRGSLTIGASTSIGVYFLPEILARFRRRYPQVDLHMEVSNTHVIQQYLTEHRVDVAVTEGFVHWPELEARVFLVDELVPIVPAGHPFASARPITLRQFCTEPLLMREQGSGTREVIEEALGRKGVVVRPMMNLGSTEAIKRSVAAGVGVAFVSALTIQQELHDRRLVGLRLRDCRMRRSLHLVQARDRSVSKAVGAFLVLLEAAVKRRSGSDADMLVVDLAGGRVHGNQVERIGRSDARHLRGARGARPAR
ncbi:MAG TPA: LysR substrate-binding domain-containing protein [Vicinamibacterales bacterium]|jgi:DNA-binding transcriptional LysR family regulator